MNKRTIILVDAGRARKATSNKVRRVARHTDRKREAKKRGYYVD